MNYKPLRWRSLVGCSPRGREESDIIEHLHFHFSLSCIGEGNGNPLQCSCLENPRDGGAWWAAIYGVAQSRIGLKWLSSSSSSSSSSRQNKYFLKSGFRVCLWSSTFTLPPLLVLHPLTMPTTHGDPNLPFSASYLCSYFFCLKYSFYSSGLLSQFFLFHPCLNANFLKKLTSSHFPPCTLTKTIISFIKKKKKKISESENHSSSVFVFCSHQTTCRVLGPMFPALDAWSFNHWSAREVPKL